jgi:hypothetical protein
VLTFVDSLPDSADRSHPAEKLVDGHIFTPRLAPLQQHGCLAVLRTVKCDIEYLCGLLGAPLHRHQFRNTLRILDGFCSVFGRESSHPQRQLAAGRHLDGSPIDPLHEGRGPSGAVAHSYNKSNGFHGSSLSIEKRTRGEKNAFRFSRQAYLRGLAVHFRFQALFAAGIYLDLLRLGFGFFGQLDL